MAKFRPMFLTIPFGVVLAVGGAALMVAANAPQSSYFVDGKAPVRHSVTPEMEKATAAEAKQPLPQFTVTDSEGKPVTLADPKAAKPQFVYFVLDGCPCSFDAEPQFHRLFDRYRDKIDFVSVTDADKKKAHDWSIQLLVNYPVVPDPEKKIIHAFGAKASVYSMLVGTDGRVIKMWPGYSAEILKQMNSLMAATAGVEEKPFDPQYAPVEKATGCAF